MTDFYRTRMGARFYEHTVPALVAAVNRLADALEAQAERGGGPDPLNPCPKEDDHARTDDEDPEADPEAEG